MLLLPAIAIGALVIEAESAMRASVGPRLKKTEEAISMFRCVVQGISTDEKRIAFCQRMIERYSKENPS